MDYIDQVICGHNVDIMRQMPHACVDLIITSPPYDNQRSYKGYRFDFDGIANECYRVLKVGGIMVWVVDDAIVDYKRTMTSFKQAIYFTEHQFWMFSTMLYTKFNPYPGNIRYTHCWEFMFILSKGVPKTTNILHDRKNLHPFGDCDKKARQKDGNLKLLDSNGRERNQYGVRTDIWFYNSSLNQSDHTALEHPASFPDQLAEDHILSWSNPNDLILDPFLGSGTTAKMAYLNGRHYCGIDISSEYCALAEKRIHLMSPAKYQSQNVKEIAKQTESLGEY